MSCTECVIWIVAVGGVAVNDRLLWIIKKSSITEDVLLKTCV